MTIEEKQLKAIRQIEKFYPISDEQIKKLESFISILISYNQEYNLIGKSTIDDIWHRHILDSAQLLQYIDNKDLPIVDFGSGAGFPAIVLSILGVKEIHLVEKSFRKCEFLKLAAKISSNKIVIHQKKVEEIKNLKFGVVVSRAFAPLNKLLAFVKPFLNQTSYCIFLKGKSVQMEIMVAKKENTFKYASFPSLTSEDGKVLVINNIN